MKLYQYPKCSTCRKASKFLKEAGQQLESIDITQQLPTVSELEQMLASYDGDIRRLFNTSGVQYRELNIKEQLPDMSNEEAIKLLAGNGKLIKRPFLLKDGEGLVGFKQEEWETFI